MESASPATSGMQLVDPSLVGGPLEALLGRPLAEMPKFEPSRYLTRFEFDAVVRHRIVPVIDESWFAPELRAEFRGTRRKNAILNLVIQGELNSVASALSGAGVDFRVLKGLATGAVDYPSTSLRESSDIDLLVRPEHLDEAVELLLGRGASHIPGGETADRSVLKGATVISANGVEVDFHTRLNRFSYQDIDVLMDRPQQARAGWSALPAELRLVHAAGHLVWSLAGHRRISGLIDIGLLRDRAVDLDRVFGLAAHLGLAGLVRAGLEAESSIRDRNETMIEGWPEVPDLERRAFLGDGRSLFFEHAFGLKGMDGLSERVRYLRQFATPDPEHVALSGGRLAHFARLLPGRS